jgi:PKD repeat protein
LRALQNATRDARLTSLQNKGNSVTHSKIISVINTQYNLLVNTAIPTANISSNVTAIQAKYEYEAFRGN